MLSKTLALSLLPLPLSVGTALTETPEILSLRERTALVDAWRLERLETVAPAIMREAEIDTWIVLAREYNEDPVIETMLPSKWMAARRRTILVLHDPTPPGHLGEPLPLKRLAVARYDIGELFESAWDKDQEPDQWRRLRDVVAELDTRRIAVNVSPTFALGDGLSSSQHQELLAALGEHASKVTTEHNLPIRWLETRTASELEAFPGICAIAHRIIAEGFSAAVVVPGETTTDDIEWWYRERIAELKLDLWFHPSVSLQRPEAGGTGEFASHAGAKPIERGDLLHVDFGITYLGLNTDTQQHAYVLREGETDAPAGLKQALLVGNRLQDILMAAFVEGHSGNTILARSLERARREGIDATIYTHPLGFHGHGAGPTIGMWDQQGGVPGRGDYPLHAGTAHSIELNAAVAIPEWSGEVIRIMLEEDAYFDGERCRFLDGRQTELLLIPRTAQ